MLARVSFIGQGQSAYEAGTQPRLGPGGVLWVSLPMARPGIVAGLSLALMEALADFGAVSVFNFDTFTTAIYKSWFGFFDLQRGAAGIHPADYCTDRDARRTALPQPCALHRIRAQWRQRRFT